MFRLLTWKSSRLTENSSKLLNNIFSEAFLSNVAKAMEEILPPNEVRGMKALDRDKFTVSKSVPALLLNERCLHSVMKPLKQYLLKLNNFKPVQALSELNTCVFDLKETDVSKFKLAYFNPSHIKKWSDFNSDVLRTLKENDIDEDNFRYSEISIKYENWSCDDVMKAILPADRESVTGYSLVGHIVHLNLREHNLEYKEIIGEVFLDKLKGCKTVVNKVNQIDSAFRNFQVEVLAGEANFVTCVKENGRVFELDFSKVYWNSRLATEHERIINLVNKGDILFDVFAGIGPFAIPVARKKCTVYANDLNPSSYHWLNHNAKLNKISMGENFKTFNLDGREFIEEVFFKFLVSFLKGDVFNDTCLHVTMNLPALAVTFLDSFTGLLNGADVEMDKFEKLKILVHVYCFVGSESPKDSAKNAVETNLKYEFAKEEIKEVFYVRNVAPNKEMMRVSFYLTSKILFQDVSCGKKRKNSVVLENEPKCKHSIC